MILKRQTAQVSDRRAYKPLIHILNPDQNPTRFPELISIELEQRERIEISRAELELRKVMTFLTSITGGATNSLPILTTLALPGIVPAILWIANILCAEESQKLQVSDLISQRNRDAYILLRAIVASGLSDWYEALVDKISFASVPSSLKFPPGHPVPRQIYRQHPLPTKQNYYYPIDSYYSYLLDERETELIQIMADLSATQIVIRDHLKLEPAHPAESGNPAHSTHQPDSSQPPKVGDREFNFPSTNGASKRSFDPSNYVWLDNEPIWKTVITGRLNHRCLSASFELNMDFSYALLGQLERIEGLLDELSSVQSVDLKTLANRTLNRRKLWITFAA